MPRSGYTESTSCAMVTIRAEVTVGLEISSDGKKLKTDLIWREEIENGPDLTRRNRRRTSSDAKEKGRSDVH